MQSSNAAASSSITGRARSTCRRCAGSICRYREGRFRVTGRAFRLGQDDLPQHPGRARPADQGQRHDRRRRDHQARQRMRWPICGCSKIGFVFQAYNLDPRAFGGGECRIHPAADGRAARGTPHARQGRARAGRADRASRTGGRRGCPAASSSAWPWRARWRADPPSCWPTSRPPISIPRRPRI